MFARGRAEYAFREQFGFDPEVAARAPGRVNLIGEHTDYNDGLVLPMAIDLDIVVCARHRYDHQLRVHSADYGETVITTDRPRGHWSDYVAGVAALLRRAGIALPGVDIAIASDLPQTAGLSSSAALEAGTAMALLAIVGQSMSLVRVAHLCRQAEHEWAGVQCGIMDQFAVLLSQPQHALLLDCRSLECELVPIPDEACFAIIDSGATRALAQSAYNTRVAECKEAARLLGASSLRDVPPGSTALAALPQPQQRRARHVVSEIERCSQAAGAMRRSDLTAFGSLMNASHQSLRDDYEVSSEALDDVVSAARRSPGMLGCRLTGAGFGGFAVALADRPDPLDQLAKTRTLTRVSPSAGAQIL